IKRDLENDKELLTLGWTVIHFWGTEINKKIDECVRAVAETIEDIEMGDYDGKI
ncbi:MAG: very short patch repair endonuclease, partial [Lachnospiraceae bacterium]|nr:very short patch repair endonuclease [Lachnospiraceae bacterium]